MPRKPDKRVYVRWNRTRRMKQLRRQIVPITKTRSNRLAQENLQLLKELLQEMQTT